MKKIVPMTTAGIVLAGCLFYALSLVNQRPSTSPTPTAPIAAKPGKRTTAIVPAPVSVASPDTSARNDAAEETAQVAADVVVGPGITAAKPEQRQNAVPQPLKTRSEGHQSVSRSKAKENPAAVNKEEPAQNPMGLRLAPDVRLPVAAMPLDFKVSPVAEKAREQIVADYYRELASPPPQPTGQSGKAPAAAASPAPAPPDVIEESETGELTRVITNSPAVDAARGRADARFKALFGNKAYNRMTMNTLLEARTPVSPQK